MDKLERKREKETRPEGDVQISMFCINRRIVGLLSQQGSSFTINFVHKEQHDQISYPFGLGGVSTAVCEEEKKGTTPSM